MTAFDDLTWHEAMRLGHEALIESEHLYEDINASEGRSNLDIEKHLRRAEVRATRPRCGSRWPANWAARASGTATQGPRTRGNSWLAALDLEAHLAAVVLSRAASATVALQRFTFCFATRRSSLSLAVGATAVPA